jgi:guanine deaminase
MAQDGFINILVAEDNDVSREMMAGLLRAQGYVVHGAINGESAIKVIQDRDIDLAIVDLNMAPTGGFEFVRYLVVKGLKIPVVIITANESSDILMTASSLGVAKVIQKPVEPDRLIQTVQRILQRHGFNPKPVAVESRSTKFSPEDIMKRAIELAEKNAKSKRGGPYGAIVTDAEGKILGEGVSGKTSRVDPTAHAEVMAIRKAADRLGKSDLSECILYCSSEPTMMGQALIISVGIQQVYYGLSHEELGQIKTTANTTQPVYTQLGHEAALEMYKAWKARK